MNPGKKRLYRQSEWFDFAAKVKARDGKCLKCHRTEPDVVLQVHHDCDYLPNRAPWEYALSDCITLCKGCHAREHGLIEPNSGWFLLSIDDLGGLDGVCERQGCNTEIRYEHLTYHPQWGYKVVGSRCIEHLTLKDRDLSGTILKHYRKIGHFVRNSQWGSGETKKGKPYIFAIHDHHMIRIYGRKGYYAYQLVLKQKGHRARDYGEIECFPKKPLDEVKELAFINLKGATSEDDVEKAMLRNLYKTIK